MTSEEIIPSQQQDEDNIDEILHDEQYMEHLTQRTASSVTRNRIPQDIIELRRRKWNNS